MWILIAKLKKIMQSNGRKRKVPIEPTPTEAMDLKSEYLRNDPGTLTEF